MPINSKFVKPLAGLALIASLNGCEGKKPLLPEDKVLTVSPKDYVESVGKKLSDYKMVGVHADSMSSHCLEELRVSANEYPNAEAITKYDLVRGFVLDRCYGVALIPKEE